MSRKLAMASFSVAALMAFFFVGTLFHIAGQSEIPDLPAGVYWISGVSAAFKAAGIGTALCNGVFLWRGGLGVRPLPPFLNIANVIFAVWAFLVFCGEVFAFVHIANYLTQRDPPVADIVERMAWLAPSIIFALVPLVGVAGVYLYIRRCRPRVIAPSSVSPTP